MKRIFLIATGSAFLAGAAFGAEDDDASGAQGNPAANTPSNEAALVVPAGTRVPLVMVNSVSSKHSQVGDSVYLQSVYPVVVGERILIPAGTHVSGSVTNSKRPGRVKGRGTLGIRLEQLILPNGVIRSLLGRPGMIDGRSPGDFDRESGTVKSEGTKGEDASDIATAAGAGASIGAIAGSVAGRTGTGLGIGSAAGAAAGLASVLLTRGPDAMLDRGTHLEMLLEGDLAFTEDELKGMNPVGAPTGGIGAGPERSSPNRGRNPGLGRFPRVGRFPL